MSKNEAVPKKRRVNLPTQAQIPFVKDVDADFSALRSKSEENIKEGVDESKRWVREDCSFFVTRHQQMKSRKLSQSL